MDFGGYLRERGLYRSSIAVKLYRALRVVAARLGLQVVLKTFYSPIPELDRLPPGTFERVSDLPGIDLRLEDQLAFLEQRLAEPMREFRPPPRATGDPHRYAVENPSYSHMDAAVLFAMVRALRPSRIVELGSGQSTLVIAEALRRGAPGTRFEVYDPYAAVITDDVRGVSAVHRLPAQAIGWETFQALGAGDILFVDTTHTVKVGSDVNFIVLEVLPRLAPGVVVHLHDIFLPFEYPRVWLEDYGLYWAEQYLVQALLAMNPGFEILIADAALTALRGDDVTARLPPGIPPGGSAFWIRRTAFEHA